MLIINPQQIGAEPVQTEGAEGVTCRLLIGREHGAPHFAMRQFTIAADGHTPLHRHDYEHEVFVLCGKGLVRSGDTYRAIHAGDVVFMPANELHQFKNVGMEALEFICLVPVDALSCM